MKIISHFKFKGNEDIIKLAGVGDVIVVGPLKYIVTDYGYLSERGTFIFNINALSKITAVIKREYSDNLEDLLTEGEKRCVYEY